MEFLVLGLLIFSNMTIYELNSSFKKGLSLIYSASYGSLQNATKKLLKLGYVEFEQITENGRNKKIFMLTPTGRDAFLNWMYGPINPNKLEVMVLSKIYFLGLIESKEDKLSIVEDMIRIAREALTELEDYATNLSNLELPDSALQIAKYQFKTLDYGIMTHQAGLDWLEKIKKTIISEG